MESIEQTFYLYLLEGKVLSFSLSVNQGKVAGN